MRFKIFALLLGNLYNMQCAPSKVGLQQEKIDVLIKIIENANLHFCKLVILHQQFSPRFEPLMQQLLKQHAEAQVVPGSLVFTRTTSYRNQSDLKNFESKGTHRLLEGLNCGLGIIFNESSLLNRLIESRYPVLRKDEDYFLFFTDLESNSVLNESQIKVKHTMEIHIGSHSFEVFSVNLYGGTMSKNLNVNFTNDLLFSDYTTNLYRQSLRISVPNYPSALEIQMNENGRYQAIRGFYLFWLKEVEIKFNFTCEYFLSSNGGASGALLASGEWSGAVGDVKKGLAHMSVDIAHIYGRIGVVEWASPFAYRGLVFVTHKAKYHYPKNIMFHPFTTALWLVLLTSAFASVACLKLIMITKVRVKSRNENCEPRSCRYRASKDCHWSTRNIVGSVTASLLEQSWKPPPFISNSSVRVYLTCWLFFVFVMATAYKAKLASLMGFPVGSFVPDTFEELLNSKFSIGINALGKGETTYIVFASGGGKTYERIFAKSLLVPNSTECITKAVSENFACITGEGVATYGIASIVPDSENGESPLQLSQTNANFIEGGVIYQKRWIYRHNFDITIRNAMNSGLVAKWWQWHMDSVKADKRKLNKAFAKGKSLESKDKVEDVFKLQKLISCFLCWLTGVLAGIIGLCIEIGNHYVTKRGETIDKYMLFVSLRYAPSALTLYNQKE